MASPGNHHHTMSEPIGSHHPDGNHPNHLGVPAHLRPPHSRHHSATSVSSRLSSSSRKPAPRPQHAEYIPSMTGTAVLVGGEVLGDAGISERVLIDQAEGGVAPPEYEGLPIFGQQSQSHRGSRAPSRISNCPAEGSPSGDDIAPGYPGSQTNDEGEERDQDEAEEEEEEELDDDDGFGRDDSISRRPAWRRPSPRWVYPFIVGVSLAMGASMAPKSELMVNLACLAHPPSAPASAISSSSSLAHVSKLYGRGMGQGVGRPLHDIGIWDSQLEDIGLDLPNHGNSDTDWSVNASLPVPSPVPSKGNNGGLENDDNLSAADKWFLRIQHEIYEYNKVHHNSSSHSSPATPSTSGTPAKPLPSGTGPIPHPSGPDQVPGDPTPPGQGSPDRGGNDSTDDPSKENNSPYHQIDPRLCKKDPKVQAASAKLTMFISMTSGILTSLTTAYWAGTSDRIGRTKVMAVVETGLLVSEVCFIIVATFPYLVPGGYRALLVGPAIDGLLGGFSTMSATMHAYISDVTPDGSRATVFARLGGIMMTGFAIGPLLGSFVIKSTGNIMIPFYINVGVHAFFIMMILFVLPESLSTEARNILAKNAALAKDVAKRRDTAEREWENETPALEVNDPLLGGRVGRGGESGWSRFSSSGGNASSKWRKRMVGRLRRLFRMAVKPLMPLAIFMPIEREDMDGDGRKSKDWNLFWVGIASFWMSMMFGVMTVKTQFTFYAYGWTSAQLGPYMSLICFSRGFVLMVAIPVIMHFIKPYFHPKPETTAEVDAGMSGFSAISAISEATESEPLVPPKKKFKRTAALDLLTIRVSLAIEMIGYFCLAWNPSQTLFVLISTWNTFGSGAGPATNSIALSFIPSAQETGRLFGGLAVLHGLGSTVLSPLLFGTLFASTVGWYAPTVFALASGMFLMAQLAYAFVRLPKADTGRSKAERGRSRVVKRVKSSGSGVNRTVDGASGSD